MAGFGRKTGVSGKKNYIFFRAFSLFRDFVACKPLIFKNMRGSTPLQKNHA
jgi:hypothetical protein